MLTIEYDPWNGIPIADEMCEKYILHIIQQQTPYIIVGTENVIMAARAMIKTGVLSCTEIEFLFKGQRIQSNNEGRLNVWPVGFCDISEKWLSELLSPVNNLFK